MCAFRKLNGMLRSSGRPMMARSEAGFNKEKPAGSFLGGFLYAVLSRRLWGSVPQLAQPWQLAVNELTDPS